MPTRRAGTRRAVASPQFTVLVAGRAGGWTSDSAKRRALVRSRRLGSGTDLVRGDVVLTDARRKNAAVVFDLDGVLVMSEHLWEAGWRSTAVAHGASWTDRDTASCQGKNTSEWGAYLAALAGIESGVAIPAVIEVVGGAYERGEVDLIDGAVEMVRAVAARVPVALASSAPRLIIDRVLTTTPLGPLFTATVSSEEVPRGKPHPDVYSAALDRLGADPRRSFAVEDSSNGIRAAAAAGLSVFGLEQEQYPVAADAAALTLGVFHALPDVHAALISALEARLP